MYWILETKTIKFKVGEEGQDRTKKLPYLLSPKPEKQPVLTQFHLRSKRGKRLHGIKCSTAICIIQVMCVTWHFHVYEKDVMRDGRSYTTIHL